MIEKQRVTKLNGAKWIGLPDDIGINFADNTIVLFRNTFNLKEKGKMELALSANNRYKLWVNGTRVATGPCRGDQWHQYYDVIDIEEYLVNGENTIAAKVVYYSPLRLYNAKKGPMCVVTNNLGPLFIAKGRCLDKEDKVLADITTGVSSWEIGLDKSVEWHDRKVGGYAVVGAFEKVEGKKTPRGWQTNEDIGFQWIKPVLRWEADGSGWGNFPALPLLKRDIPPMFETPKQFKREMDIRTNDLPAFSFNKDPLTLKAGFKGVVELDAGELTTGYFLLKTQGGLGSHISITYAESYSTPQGNHPAIKGIRDDSLNHIIHGFYDEYLPSGEEDDYETFWFRTFRFIRLEVTVGENPLTLHRPHYIETGYPLESKSYIESSSPWIKPLWEISIRTLQRCMHETYEDCPYYEQLQYALDTRLQILFTYALSGDSKLAARALRDFYSTLIPEGLLSCRAPTDEVTIIPAFSLYWIQMLEDYYWQTKDIEAIIRYRPAIDSILSWFHRRIGRFGLIEDIYYWEFIDWADEWHDEMGTLTAMPQASYEGPCTTTNLVYVAALESAASLMEITGRQQLADEYRKNKEAIIKAVDSHCWSKEKFMYREGPDIEEYTQHAQSWAVLTKMVKGDKAKRILENSLEREGVIECTFVYSFFLFRALEKAGMYEKTEKLWNKWKKALEYNVTTWPEDLIRQRSDCHAWGSLPLYEFTRCILGVRPAKPGWEEIVIHPIGLYLSDAQGEAITPKGIVKVKWYKENGKFFLEGEVPEGLPFKVVLPWGEIKEYANGGYFSHNGSI